MPKVAGVLETSLYVDDVETSADFYRRVFQFGTLTADDRLVALSVDARQVLLLFRKGATSEPQATRGGTIPGHDGQGHLHLAFAIAKDERDPWRKWLQACGVAIESEVSWLAGGHSLYFRDPDHNLVELLTSGTWSIY